MISLPQLFCIFARIGFFSFGGLNMLPFLQREIVDKYHWLTEQELLDFYAIAQCTPGIIAVNTATYIGYKKRGVIGAITCTLAIVLPPLFTILLCSMLLDNLFTYPVVQHALAGVRVGVCALLTASLWRLLKAGVKDKLTFTLAVGALAVTLLFRPSPIYIIVFAIVLGAFFLNRIQGGARK